LCSPFSSTERMMQPVVSFEYSEASKNLPRGPVLN
jgi:hypothetical protein